MSEENFDWYLDIIKDTLTERGTKYDDAFHKTWEEWGSVSYTHLTLPTNREV